MTDYLDHRFSAQIVAKAANISPATLQNWLNRGMVIGQKNGGIEGGGKRGKPRLFTFENVMEISIAAAIIAAHLGELRELERAFKAAAIFAHTGEAALPGKPERRPGFPFKGDDVTLLAIAGDKTALALWKPGEDCFAVIRSELGRPSGFVLIEVNGIFDRTVTALGEDPRDLLDEVYGEV